MAVSSIGESDWTKKSGSTSSTNETEEQMSEFFTLLLAQMQHQDPMEPMSNEEMMAQFAQLTTVQELQNLTAAVEEMTTASALSDATALIGKTVIATDKNDKVFQGVVDMVYIGENGDVTLNVDGQQISLEYIDVVYNGDNTMNSSLESLASSSALSYASSLIGKYIEAEVEVTDEESEDTETEDGEEDEEETETTTISGFVESVEITDEGIIMFLDNDEQVLLSDVVRVMQSAPSEDETTTEDNTTDDTTSTESTNTSGT